MALTLVNLSGHQYGVAADETSINIRQFRLSIAPQFKTYLPGKTNENKGFVFAPMRRELTMEGEISGSSGPLAAVPQTAFVPANSVSYYSAIGGFYFDNAQITEDRGNFKDGTFNFSSDAGIT